MLILFFYNISRHYMVDSFTVPSKYNTMPHTCFIFIS
uniref:Uncharacterized protein n=1 Tax=Anguilla anguilla TaxID=7936 RepID=A0A0E9R9K3_ANGAN